MLNLYRYTSILLIAFFLTACGSPQPAEAATKAMSIQFLLSQVRTTAGPLAGGKVDFYAAGTTTRKTVWLDRNKATPAANPYTLDSNGTAQLYGDGLYRIVIKDSAGVTKYDRDYISIRDVAGLAYDVADYGSLAAACTALNGTGATLQFGTDQTLSANLVTDVELMPLNGAKINHGAYTISYGGSTARWPLAQVFNGSGAVRLTNCAESYPEWWGVDGAADEVQIHAAIAAHGDSATTITGGKVVLVGGYNVSSTVLIFNKSIEIEGRGFGNVANSVPSYIRWTGIAGLPMIRVQSCRGTKIKNLRLIGDKSAKPTAAIDMYVDNNSNGGAADISQNSFNVFENIWIGHYDGLDTAQTGAVGDYQFTNGIYFNGDNTGNNYNTFKNIRIGMANNGVNIAGNQYGQNTFDGLWATFCYYGFAIKAPAIGHDWFFDNNQEADILIEDDARLMLYDYSSERSNKMAVATSGGRLSIIGGTFSTYSGSQGTVFDGYGGNPATLYLEDFALQQEQGNPYVGTPQFTLRSDNDEDVKAFIGRRCRGITFAMLDMNTNSGNALSRHTVDLEVIGTYGSANDSLTIKNLLIGPSKTVDPARYDTHLQYTWQTAVFENAWAAQDAVNTPLRYIKDFTGRVQITGTTNAGTSGTTVFTLPAGYRPPLKQIFPVAMFKDGVYGAAIGHVGTDGTVKVYFPAGTLGYIGIQATFLLN